MRAAVRSGHSAPDLTTLERICAGVDRTLREIAADRNSWGLERLRAIELLARYPSQETNALLGQLATAGDELLSVRRTAVTVLGQSSTDVSAELLQQVDALAAHETDPDLRAVAAETARKQRGVR